MADGSKSPEEAAAAALAAMSYEELRRIASRLMRAEREGHTLRATALVHEAFIKLAQDEARRYASPLHYVRTAVRAMRHTLIDYARSTTSQRRDYGLRVTLDEAHGCERSPPLSLLELCEVLQQLDEVRPKLAAVFELRALGGLSVRECAEALGISQRTVNTRWEAGRAWVADRLSASVL
ncbi:MAG: ECF-type sigma factor [Pseudomonadota bacterium]